jgi:hypothetical protein
VRKISGGRNAEDIPSFAPEWKRAEQIRLRSMPREGAPDSPVVCDPVRRG